VATRLLIVEDDDDVRLTLRLLLEDEGYDVSEAADGDEGLARFASDKPALVILDLKLPGKSGFDVCRALRQQSDVPIIMVTAQVDSFDVVAGLEAGADDYVTKPFVPKELAARIRAQLRRWQGSLSGDSNEFHVGDLVIRPDEGVVLKGDEEVHLTRTEFKLLCDFAANPGRVFSREVLLERVWGYDYLGDGRLVDAHIRRLRTKVEDDPGSPRHIVTVRGLGYKLVP